jgi:hypothetical protein
MTLFYILAILLQIGVIVYFIRRNKIQQKRKGDRTHAQSNDSYNALRTVSLGVTAAHLKLSIPASETIVYGVVMDWHMGDLFMTLAAYLTGAANMYLSTGENIKGGGNNPHIGEVAAQFVAHAQHYKGRAIAVPSADLPPRESVRFHLLTNHGILSAQEQMIHFEDGTSPWLPLFEMGSVVITEMRNLENGLVNAN